MSDFRAELRLAIAPPFPNVEGAPCSDPLEAGRIGYLLEKLFDAESTGGRFVDLENRLAGRANQLPCNVDHLPAKPPRVGRERNPCIGGLLFLPVNLESVFLKLLVEIEGEGHRPSRTPCSGKALRTASVRSQSPSVLDRRIHLAPVHGAVRSRTRLQPKPPSQPPPVAGRSPPARGKLFRAFDERTGQSNPRIERLINRSENNFTLLAAGKSATSTCQNRLIGEAAPKTG